MALPTKADISSAGLLLLLVVCVGLTVVTCFYYPGNVLTYLAFSILVNALLFAGLRSQSIFFDFNRFALDDDLTC